MKNCLMLIMFKFSILVLIFQETNAFDPTSIISAGIGVLNFIKSVVEAKEMAQLSANIQKCIAKTIEALAAMNNDINTMNAQLDDFINNFENSVAYEMNVHAFIVIVTGIGTLYDHMQLLVWQEKQVDPMATRLALDSDESEKMDLVNEIISHSTDSLRTQINMLVAYLDNSYQDDFASLNIIKPLMQTKTHQHAKQIAESIYQAYIITESRANALFVYAYTYLATQQDSGLQKKYTGEIHMVQTEFVRRLRIVSDYMDGILHLNQTLMEFFERDGDETRAQAIELIGVERAILLPKVDLPQNRQCQKACKEEHSPPDHEVCVFKPICKTEMFRCEGKLTECIEVNETQMPVEMCTSPSHEDRRLIKGLKFGNGPESPEYGDLKAEGVGMACINIEREAVPLPCGLCLCRCVDELIPNGKFRDLRYFDMRPVETNVADNKVVTGARFSVRKGMIYTEIREGRMTSPTEIDQESVGWLPIVEHDPSFKNDNSGTDEKYFKISPVDRSVMIGVVNSTGHNTVVTGIRYKQEGEKNLLVPQIRFHAYDGAKLVNESWVDARDSYIPWEREIQETAADILANITRDKFASVPRYVKNVYVSDSHSPGDAAENDEEVTMESQPIRVGEITFKTTSLEYDVAQTIIPFLDGSDSVADPAVPLHCFGLHYKSFKSRPGFIGLKLGTYNFLNYIRQIKVPIL